VHVVPPLFFFFFFFTDPGIVTRIFVSLKCQTIGDEAYLVADWSVVCWKGEHAEYAAAMGFFACVYVVGIPAGLTLILYLNRHLLHSDDIDEKKEKLIKKSKSFEKIYGSLYEAYEKDYWWFESVIMIQKALLTGGLVLVAPGSSAQILVGLIVALLFYTVLLKTQPYGDDDEDMMQSVATASTVMTLLLGFALKSSYGAGESGGDYDAGILDGIMIVLFITVALCGVWITSKTIPNVSGLCSSEKKSESEEDVNRDETGKELVIDVKQ